MKLALKLAVAILTFLYSLPAFSGQFQIQTGPGWIKAKANGVGLGEVFTQVAEKTGYKIYIDEELEKVPATFSFKENLSPEKAIRRMVRPHSYAVVFGSDTKDKAPNILEVWVFRKGHQLTTRYIALTPAPGAQGKSASAGVSSASQGSAGGSGRGRSIKGKNLIKRELFVKKTAFGTRVLVPRDPSKGPDYRPTADQMRQAYVKFQRDKKRYLKRRSDASFLQSRRDSEQAKNQHRARRNEQIRSRVRSMKMKNNNK